jgi:hypothetical protein
MSIYPAIIPDRISYDLGQLNISEEATFSGPVRFRHSMQTNGYGLQLTYNNLRQSQVDQLRRHYFDSSGSHRLFRVPAAIWGGASVVSTDSLYRYNDPPGEEHLGVYFNVTVNLRIIAGVNLLNILDGGGALQPAVAPFQSFVFTGNAPFILDAGGASPTLLLDCRGASQ